MLTELLNNSMALKIQITHTVVSLVVLAWIYALAYLLLSKRYGQAKSRKRFNARLFYTFILLATIIIAEIWMNGFTHILAVLSLVSAALVVTNKELVMNVVGGLIINWRSLFTEGDQIRLQNYSGTVTELGILYFRLFESSPNTTNRSSGKLIKIPNGFVINNAIINFSHQSNFIEYEQTWLAPIDCHVTDVKKLLVGAANEVLQPYYHQDRNRSIEDLKKRNEALSKLINFQPNLNIHMTWSKPTGISFVMSYYCYPKDHDRLDLEIIEKILLKMKEMGVTFVNTT